MRLLLTLGVLLVAATASLATDPYRYRQPYVAPVYQTQRVFVAETAIVPIVVPAALMVHFGPSTAPPPVTIAPAALAEAHGQTAAVLARMEALERKLDRLLSPPMPRADAAVPAGALAIVDPPPPRPSLLQAAALMKQHCMQCHAGQNARGDVRLFDDQGAYNPNVPPAVILAAVKSDRMPKTPAKLSPQEKALLEAWAAK